MKFVLVGCDEELVVVADVVLSEGRAGVVEVMELSGIEEVVIFVGSLDVVSCELLF